MSVTGPGERGRGETGRPADAFPANRLQIPHLVAAKMSDDETEGYVVITVARGVTTMSEATADWDELLRHFPNLRTEFFRSGHQMYQRILDINDCAARVIAMPHRSTRTPSLDSFTHPSMYVWDPLAGDAQVWLHHAVVDSFTVDLLKRRRWQATPQPYEEFLARLATLTGRASGTPEDLCHVGVRRAAQPEGWGPAELTVEAVGQQEIQAQGAFNFWFACLCDSLEELGVSTGGKILVPMSFRDLLGELYAVPGLAMGSVAVDIAPAGTDKDHIRRGLVRSLRERPDRLALAAWSTSATVPLEFAYDDAGARLARMRRQAGVAGIEVIHHSPTKYLLVCSAGMGLEFTDFGVGDLLKALARSARRRGVQLGFPNSTVGRPTVGRPSDLPEPHDSTGARRVTVTDQWLRR